MKAAPALVVDNLSQRYGDLVLFTHLSFRVAAGRALVVTGENGSGKSTLLRTIAGLMAPDAGAVRLEGGADEATIAEQCHHVSFLNATKPELTATENLALWRDILGEGEGAVSIAEALDRLGLSDFANSRVEILSTGLRRRVALARVLVAHRPLWLLDEPTAALDQASCGLVAEMIEAHLKAGGLAVIATHLDLGIEGLDTLDLTPASSTAAASP